jgi:hypothetical protein
LRLRKTTEYIVSSGTVDTSAATTPYSWNVTHPTYLRRIAQVAGIDRSIETVYSLIPRWWGLSNAAVIDDLNCAPLHVNRAQILNPSLVSPLANSLTSSAGLNLNRCAHGSAQC